MKDASCTDVALRGERLESSEARRSGLTKPQRTEGRTIEEMRRFRSGAGHARRARTQAPWLTNVVGTPRSLRGMAKAVGKGQCTSSASHARPAKVRSRARKKRIASRERAGFCRRFSRRPGFENALPPGSSTSVTSSFNVRPPRSGASTVTDRPALRWALAAVRTK